MTTVKSAVGEASARALDAADPLSSYRDRFVLPIGADGRPKAYLAGMSLGAQPIGARDAVERELDAWARFGVDGWFAGERGWLEADGVLREATAGIVGARPDEVATLNTLTVNLHLLLAAFFRPVGRRTAILIDAPTFPSDRYAVESQLRHHGLDPAADLVVVRPRAGEDRCSASRTSRGRSTSTAIDWRSTLLAGVNYATGQLHDIGRLTGAIHEAGAIAGWDLAHGAGNVPLGLHDADVDFAAWCTYKYLNGGPGALGQLFVHERHAASMPDAPARGLVGQRRGDPVRDGRDHRSGAGRRPAGASRRPRSCRSRRSASSLAMFDEVGMTALRERSVALTALPRDGHRGAACPTPRS